MNTDAPSQIELDLKVRVRRLVEEKSSLQLVLSLIARLDSQPTIDAMINSMLYGIVESIGGTNIKLYYWMGETLHYADFLGIRTVLAEIDDPFVAQVVNEHKFVEIATNTCDALLHGDVVPGAWIWGFPLLLGNELLGVIKLENIHIGGAALREFLPVFFRHAALILSNEIRNYKREQAEAALESYRLHLEQLVIARTLELEAAKAKAEAANRAKSIFLSNMSHELRTPLNAILGFSELMSLDNEVSIKQKENLAIINRSGAHLLNMINDVLDISKIEAGRLELDIQAFDLIGLLNDIGVMINIRAVKKQLRFALDIAPDTAQFIRTDSGKLRQVLINLLGNAIKFTEKGSVILRARIKALVLTLEVIDSGMGIPANKLHELFKPFVQLVQNNADVQGTGLGLVISKSLVELMGGTISVNSEFGIGSTFKIDLPVKLATATDVIAGENIKVVKHLAPNQPVWRLLVVDDNADNRLLLATMLADMGFQIREAENGQEVIKVFEDWKPHLIWMDMRMPVMNGYEATMKIRQLAGGDKVKIIALTASAFKEQHSNIIKAGCDAVLHKPF
ncbi:MAG: ATP-binding protein, partial [Methylococcales bacterium]|nr:ATP-binding protein [Methylococcales bacterium]